MASKLNNNVNKAIVLYALLGLLVGAFTRIYFHGLHKNVGENQTYLAQQFDKVGDTVTRNIQEGIVTLAVKFLHFFISKWLQYRYLPVLLVAPSTMSLLFWVAFTGSISLMLYNPL
ncbi:hypothetical protein COLO4_35259 [Corchorus olitorius]|uniref:Uncharacterized protein n=1 Tax=Corchorus olitorius TaxID=93759 RepID=A0A1R3GHJ3_9ROSI|nr:hypothetical protein COLO4_35259 [Corchorus olitorius]